MGMCLPCSRKLFLCAEVETGAPLIRGFRMSGFFEEHYGHRAARQLIRKPQPARCHETQSRTAFAFLKLVVDSTASRR
jgi:hypothetical protein